MTNLDVSAAGETLWSPPADAWERTRMGHFLTALAAEHGTAFASYQEAWAWSVAHPGAFWDGVWDLLDIVGERGEGPALADDAMPGAVWFPSARLNYAENALRADLFDPDDVAVVARSQTRDDREVTFGELTDDVARCAAGLRRLGVGIGDRVAAYVPNVPEAVIAFLATASIGAIWSSCAPEFGTRSVIDRFAQIEPTVLLTLDGYRYGARVVDRGNEISTIRAALPTLAHTVVLPYLSGASPVPDAITWDDLLAEPAELTFEPVPFDHPLWVMYSSGTTGLPKAIMHGHGGVVLELLKVTALHHDLGPGDRFFWFTTTGWVMWNYLVSALMAGSAIVLFDGDPAWPALDGLWQLGAETGCTAMGMSPGYLMACRKAGERPRDEHDLSRLRELCSAGAPLPPEGFRWVYDAVGSDLYLGSFSGGTDVSSIFVGGAPLLPVRAGEIACRALGAAVEAFDQNGKPVIGQRGELVLTAPLPSMPVGFWGDEDGARYRAAYFADYPGVWRHGDWITITEHGSCIIHGRSDATLNRGGVRLGTSEFYTVVESDPRVADSLVVHLEDEVGGKGELLLFIVTVEGADMDEHLRGAIAKALRQHLSPRHVPDQIVAVPAVPRTLSGKRCEIPVKQILMGTDPAVAVSADSLTNPSSLGDIIDFARQRATPRTP